MKTSSLSWLLLSAAVLLHGCGGGNQATSSADLNSFGTITNYENHYNASSQLERTVETLYEYMGRDTMFYGMDEQIYHYDGDKLILKERFKLNPDSTKTLLRRVEYTDRQRVETSYRDGKQDSYSLVEKDAEGRLIRRVEKKRLIVPDFGININDDYQEHIEYDEQGEQLYSVLYDMATGQCTQTYYTSSNNTVITPRSSDRKMKELIVKRVSSIVTSQNDTTITHTYINKQLSRVEKEFSQNGRKMMLVYNSEGELLSSVEEFTQDSMDVNIYTDRETNYTNSTFYKNNLALREVSSDDNGTRETIYQYDQHGNPTRMVMVMKNCNKPIEE